MILLGCTEWIGGVSIDWAHGGIGSVRKGMVVSDVVSRLGPLACNNNNNSKFFVYSYTTTQGQNMFSVLTMINQIYKYISNMKPSSL